MGESLMDTDHVVCLGGGNALGAFYGGVVEVLAGNGVVPVHVSGTSIGAITAALWMGGPPEGAVQRLRRFWDAATDRMVIGAASAWRRQSVIRALLYGRPGLFQPSFPGLMAALPGAPPDDHLFDTGPMRRLLAELVDFDALNASPCRVTVSAMDQMTAEVLRFDNHAARLGVDHILASAALPIAFPPVLLDGRPLIDAGLADNCPVEALLDRPITRATCAWIADLWPATDRRAGSLDLALRRTQDLAFAAQRLRALQQFRAALRRAGDQPPVRIVEIVHDGAEFEIGGKAFDFTPAVLARRWAAGHSRTLQALEGLGAGEPSRQPASGDPLDEHWCSPSQPAAH